MPAATRFARAAFAIFALLCVATWLPVAVVTYVPGWHEASCDWHDRCDGYSDGRTDAPVRIEALMRIEELRAFMQHRGELARPPWTRKEIRHLTEVRGMLDKWAVFAGLSLLVLMHADARERMRAARWVLIGVAACVVILPFFGTFWRDVFHPLLFRNGGWMNYRSDVSWWIMPRLYFQYTTALVIGVAVIVTALVRVLSEPRASGPRSSPRS